MHVGLVVYGDLETTTGGFLYDRKLAAHLRDHGHRVSVVSLPGHAYPRALADSLDPRIRRRLRGYDLLLEDELCHPSLVGHNRAIDAPIVTIVHHLRASERWPAWQKLVYRAIEHRYLRTTDAAVYASETTRRNAERLAGERPSVVARPAGDRFDPEIATETIAARADRDPFRVLFVGSLVPRKGLHVLLDGLARVAGDWRLSVVGSESDEAYARDVRQQAQRLGIRDRVRFEGRLPDAELADRFRESHLLAVPSLHEGYGIVYPEAMGFGVPPLATTSGGASELITHGEDGLLVPPEDSEAVADAVESLRTDRATLCEMGVAARRRYERHPSWDESMGKIRQFLQRVARGGRDKSEAIA